MRNKNTAGLRFPIIQELQLKQKPGDSQVDQLEPALPQRQTQPHVHVRGLASSSCSCPTPWQTPLQTAPNSPQLPPNSECVSCGTGAAWNADGIKSCTRKAGEQWLQSSLQPQRMGARSPIHLKVVSSSLIHPEGCQLC